MMVKKHFLLIVLLLYHCQALTYWIDPYCPTRVFVALREATRFCRIAATRLATGDSVALYHYKVIFKIPDAYQLNAGDVTKVYGECCIAKLGDRGKY